MSDETFIIKGYQPTFQSKDGYQPTADIQAGSGQNPSTSATVKIVPPKGGTGEVTLKKN